MGIVQSGAEADAPAAVDFAFGLSAQDHHPVPHARQPPHRYLTPNQLQWIQPTILISQGVQPPKQSGIMALVVRSSRRVAGSISDQLLVDGLIGLCKPNAVACSTTSGCRRVSRWKLLFTWLMLTSSPMPYSGNSTYRLSSSVSCKTPAK